MILIGITDTQKKKYSAIIPNLQWMCILAALCVMFSKFLTSRLTMSYFTIIIVTTNRSARHNCSIHQSQAALTRLFFSWAKQANNLKEASNAPFFRDKYVVQNIFYVYKLKFKDTDFFLSPSGIFVSGARDGAQLAEKGTNANYGGSAAERGVGLNLKVWIKVKGNWMGGGHLGVNSVK